MKKMLEYSIGLDIGTNSVGWCVTDLKNNILKVKGKLLKGIRIFDSAQQASSTRIYRSARRRRERRKQRIKLLQELMAEDVLQKDDSFYFKLSETRKWLEDRADKSSQYNIFKELEFNDKEYYKKYPTIYHLRNHLVNSKEKEDIRLVYLAIHHIIKYRGNFLYEGQEFSKENNNLEEGIQQLLEYMKEQDINSIEDNIIFKIVEILRNKQFNNSKKEEQIRNLFVESKNPMLVNIAKLIVGNKADLNKIFDIGTELKISLSEEFDEASIQNQLGDNFIIFEMIKNIYSSKVLSEILEGVNYISEAFIEKYNSYKNDLSLLKKVYKVYLPNKYNFMFRKEGINQKTYFTYNERNVYNGKRHKCASKSSEGCDLKQLYNTIKNDLKGLENNEAKEVLKKIEDNNFLIKLNTVDNVNIPYQVNLVELKRIIDNQSQYYGVLQENKDKIIALLKFRIPYYVGPLSDSQNPINRFSWVQRKEEGKIYPWNFEEKIDIASTAEKFITKMTNKCTYLKGKDVIPKNSLLYSEFCVLNEINNLRITDQKSNIKSQKIGIDAKKDIIENIFKKRKKVTEKELKNYLINNQYYKTIDVLSGFAKENEFASSLTSYCDFTKIFGQVNDKNYDMIEQIIFWRTVFETNDILKKKINENYPNISEEQINKICKLKYSGWSRLSKELLIDIKSFDNESIMDLLNKSQMNFMQIITDKKLGIAKKIDDEEKKDVHNHIKYDMISELQGSPAIKRGIWQSILVVKELVDVMKYEPKNIYIEMAREDGEKKRTISRYDRLKGKYSIIDNEDYKAVYNELKNNDNIQNKDLNEKLYLYFTQNGKCLYSGKTLNINELDKTCEVDHILPRTFTKDDSLDNKALVLKEYNQKKTDNLVLEEDIRRKQSNWWMQLLTYGLITREKYDALTKNSITDKEKEIFIKRQLVETRQITKHVVNILMNNYSNTNVFALKANLVSQFRKKYEIPKNRNINDFHHADDAYILSVIGNYIDSNFKKEKNEYIYDEYINAFKKMDRNVIFRMKYNGIIESFNTDTDKWNHNKEIEKVKYNISKREYLITKKLEEGTGEFCNQTIYDKNYSSDSKIELKKGEDVNKYGCKTSENVAYMCIIEFKQKDKWNKQLIGIPIQISMLIKNKQITLKEYLKKLLNTKEFNILKSKILKYQLIQYDNGHCYRLVSNKQLNNAKQLILPKAVVIFLNECSDNKNANYETSITNELKMIEIYDLLLEKIKNEYLDYGAEYKNLKEGYEKFRQLEANDKIKALNQIISILGKSYGKIDFINKNNQGCKYISNSKLDEVIIIEQSITGIYERRYKVNELANSSGI